MSQSQTLSERQAVANAAGPEVLTAYVQDGHSMCITHDMRYDIDPDRFSV